MLRQASPQSPKLDSSHPRPTPSGPSFFRRLRLGLGRSRLDFLTRITRDYGDCVHFTVGHWEYWFFTHPDAVKDVLVTHDSKFMKGPALRRAKDTLGEGLLTSEGELHTKQRRLVQPALHPQRVATYAAKRVESGETITLLCSSACVRDSRCHRSILKELIGANCQRACKTEPALTRTLWVNIALRTATLFKCIARIYDSGHVGSTTSACGSENDSYFR